MRIVHYTHAAGSGAGRYVANLTTALAATGADIVLICPSDFADLTSVRQGGVRAVASSPSLAGARGQAAKLRRALRQTTTGLRLARRERRPGGIVHLNFVGIPLLALPILAGLRACGSVLVLTVHDVEPHRPVLGRRMRPVERLALRALYRLPRHLVVHYSIARTELQRSFAVQGDRITVIPHGTVIAPAGPAEAAPRSRVRIAVLGGIRRNKGIHLAIEAIQDLRRRDIPVELTIAGSPSDAEAAYWRSCRTAIDRQPDGIRVIDRFLSDAEMRQEMARADAVLLPYDRFAAQSGVASDALGAGRALIATRAGGLAELVEASGAAIVIQDATVASVAAAVMEAVEIGLPGLSELGRAGQAYARDHLGWPAVAERHVQLYRALAAQ